MAILSSFRSRISTWFSSSDPKTIGIYGPANAGKSTLTNQIITDWSDDVDGDFTSASEVPHETRRAKRSDEINIERDGGELTINVVDTPGVETKVNYEEFDEYGIEETEAMKRSREATEGIAEAMHWLREDIDGVIYVLDSTKDPITQVNTMIIGIIESENLPVVILANKTDLPKARVKRIKDSFPQHPIVPVSALEGHNLDDAYDTFTEEFN